MNPNHKMKRNKGNNEDTHLGLFECQWYQSDTNNYEEKSSGEKSGEEKSDLRWVRKNVGRCIRYVPEFLITQKREGERRGGEGKKVQNELHGYTSSECILLQVQIWTLYPPLLN